MLNQRWFLLSELNRNLKQLIGVVSRTTTRKNVVCSVSLW